MLSSFSSFLQPHFPPPILRRLPPKKVDTSRPLFQWTPAVPNLLLPVIPFAMNAMPPLPLLPSRRGLLAALAAAPTLTAQNRYQPVFAGQAYVWSQHFARQNQKMEDHFDQILGSFRKAGYSTLELVGSAFFAPQFAERTAGLLRKHKLKVPVVYNGGERHAEAGAEKTIAATLDLARRARRATGLLESVATPTPSPRAHPSPMNNWPPRPPPSTASLPNSAAKTPAS